MTYYLAMERGKGGKVWTPMCRPSGTTAYFHRRELAVQLIESQRRDDRDYYVAEVEVPE